MRSSLSRRIYNSSFTLAISFGFYALIFAFTLSCDAEEGRAIPLKSSTNEVTQQVPTSDTTVLAAKEVISYVENMTE